MGASCLRAKGEPSQKEGLSPQGSTAKASPEARAVVSQGWSDPLPLLPPRTCGISASLWCSACSRTDHRHFPRVWLGSATGGEPGTQKGKGAGHWPSTWPGPRRHPPRPGPGCPADGTASLASRASAPSQGDVREKGPFRLQTTFSFFRDYSSFSLSSLPPPLPFPKAREAWGSGCPSLKVMGGRTERPQGQRYSRHPNLRRGPLERSPGPGSRGPGPGRL